MTREELHVAFEAWFNKKYEWEIRRARRGYDLNRNNTSPEYAKVGVGEYYWEIPDTTFEAFKGAMIMAGVYTE